MGSLIAPDYYISNGVLTRCAGYETLARIARMQIVIGNRWGHILQLNTEKMRKMVLSSAKRGYVPVVPAYCQRCGAGAFLSDWVKYSFYSKSQCALIRASLLPDNPEWRLDFMDRCKGHLHAEGELAILESAIKGRW
jgi:hypothetical protein